MVEKSSRQYIEEIKSIRRQMAYSEQQKSEYLETIEKLTQSEKIFRDLAENDPDWTFWLNPDDRLVYVSASSRRITGYDPEDFKKDTKLLFKMIHPDDRTSFGDHLRFAHKSKTITEEEFRIIHKDKKMRWISQITQPAYDAEGEYAGLITSNRDITDSKTRDDAPRDSDTGYQLLAQNMNDVIWVLDATLRPTYVSPSVEQMLGFTVEEAMDQNLRVTLTSASFHKFNDIWTSDILHDRSAKSAAAPSVTLTLELRGKDGSSVWAECRLIPLRSDDKKIVETIMVCRNISESVEARGKLAAAEKQLRQIEDQIKILLDAATESLYLTDADGLVLVANETAARRLGANPAALPAGFNLYDFLSADACDRLRHHFLQAQKLNKPVSFQEEIAGRTIANTVYPVADEGGTVTRFAIFGTDITERLSAEAAAEESMHGLVESERLKKALINAASVRIYWKDKRSVYLGCNRLFALDAGRERPEDLIGDTDKNLTWRDQASRMREEDQAVMGGKISILNREERQTAADGRKIWVRATKVPLSDAEGRVIGVIGAYEDITEYKQSQERLAAAEQKNIDHALQLEKAAQRLSESEKKLLDTGTALLEIEKRFEESRTRSAENEKSLQEKQTRFLELEQQLKDTRERLNDSSLQLQEAQARLREMEEQLQNKQDRFKDQEKQMLENQAGLQEIERQLGKTTYQLRESEKHAQTMQKRLQETENQLEEQQRLLTTRANQVQALLDTATETIFLLDPDGKVLYANETTARCLHTDLSKLLAARSMYEFLPPEVAKKRSAYLADVLKTGQPVRFEDERAGITFLNSIYPVIAEDGKVVQLAVFGMDITDRKRAELNVLSTSDQVQAANRMLSLVIDALPVRVFWKDDHSVYLGANQLFARDMGKNHPRDLIGQTDDTLVPPALAKQYRQDDQAIIASGQPKTDYEEPLSAPGGQKRWLRTTKIPLTDLTGKIIGVLGVYDDITEQKNAAAELAESEKRYRSLFENNHMPMLLIDPAGGAIVDANPAACRYYGWPREEFTAKKISDINTLPLREINRNLNLAGTQKRNHFIFKHRRADGSVRDVEAFSGPIQFKGKSILYSIIYDITDRIQMEQTLRQTEKLDSLGILAGGIAHDFNNLMTVVQGHLDVALLSLPDDHPVSASLQTAQEAVEKTRDITSRLITFSRGGAPLLKVRRIQYLLAETARHSLKSSNIDLTLPAESDLWPAEIDEMQIKQCFCHLVDNAGEAMPEGGSLAISAENVYITEADALPLVEGPYLKIIFQDSGVGISAEHIARIFDPYYSTKPMSKDKGMGLGLAVCHSVLKKHGGYITVSSEEGQGAAFSLFLPAKPGALVEEEPQIVEPAPALQRILIMDDNADIRRILEIYLEKLGFLVVAVAEGQETIRQYREAKETDDPFTAVFMEISVKQGLGGEATLSRLINIDPDVKAVAILSEHSDSRAQKFLDLGFKDVLGKPFRLEDMKRLLNTLLDS